jgi:hypothetical protein
MGDEGLHEKNETLRDPKYDGRINILCGRNGNKSPMHNVRKGVHVRAALIITLFVFQQPCSPQYVFEQPFSPQYLCSSSPDHHNICVPAVLITTEFVFQQS